MRPVHLTDHLVLAEFSLSTSTLLDNVVLYTFRFDFLHEMNIIPTAPWQPHRVRLFVEGLDLCQRCSQERRNTLTVLDHPEIGTLASDDLL